MKRSSIKWIGPVLVILILTVLLWPTALDWMLRGLFPEAGEWVFPRAAMAQLMGQHLLLSLTAGILAAVIGVAAGIGATRPKGRPFLPLVRDLGALAQTIPPAAVLALAIPFLGFGLEPTLVALVLYSVLPVLNNTVVGLQTLPPAVVEAGGAMGMTKIQRLLRVELPLAAPTIGAGIRISMVINVGTATLGALAGAGGLGSPIVAGLVRNNPAWVFQGALASAVIALAMNGFLLRLERFLTRG